MREHIVVLLLILQVLGAIGAYNADYEELRELLSNIEKEEKTLKKTERREMLDDLMELMPDFDRKSMKGVSNKKLKQMIEMLTATKLYDSLLDIGNEKVDKDYVDVHGPIPLDVSELENLPPIKVRKPKVQQDKLNLNQLIEREEHNLGVLAELEKPIEEILDSPPIKVEDIPDNILSQIPDSKIKEMIETEESYYDTLWRYWGYVKDALPQWTSK